MAISFHHQTKTVQDFIHLYESNQLNLEPAFQRDSVWRPRQRSKLVDSIFRGYPLPSIFLYRRRDSDRSGGLAYDVIDGKQRLESILGFCGVMWGQRFSARLRVEEHGSEEPTDWRRLGRLSLQHRISGFELQVTEVEGDLDDIIDLFVRLNSTGTALSGQEVRHARYFHSRFLREADKLARNLQPFLVRNRILGESQLQRMKHIQLVCELVLSAYQEDVLNKKAAVDAAMKSKDLDLRRLNKAVKQTKRAVRRVRSILPNLRETRFRQLADFYTLVVLVQQLERENFALPDRRRQREAGRLLTRFAARVDEVRERQKRVRGIPRSQEVYRDYLMTVQADSDEISRRKRRHEILRDLVGSVFERKDARRLFSEAQSRLIWNREEKPRCRSCHKKLTWGDITIDHKHPHSLGGLTTLKNAQLLCRSCNSKKGNRLAA